MKLREAVKKLDYLLHSQIFPPETFENLLFLYCKYQLFDSASKLMTDNPKFCETLLDKDDYSFIKTLVTTQSASEQQKDPKDSL